MPRHATILALCAWLSSPAAQAAETVFSCDVVQESSGTRYPEIITLDTERGVITHLKREWLDGRPSDFVDGEEQFVTIDKDALTWGRRRSKDGTIEDRFTLDLRSGRYAWFDEQGLQISHGACRTPDLAS